MNHSSERASPGGCSALSRNWTSRWVFVNVPSFSMCEAAGIRNTSVWIVLGAQLARLHLRRVAPESGGLDLGHVAYDQPLQLGQRAALKPGVLRADRRVLPHHKQALHPAVQRAEHRREVGVVAGHLGSQPKP